MLFVTNCIPRQSFRFNTNRPDSFNLQNTGVSRYFDLFERRAANASVNGRRRD